jgi:hypothetical protein
MYEYYNTGNLPKLNFTYTNIQQNKENVTECVVKLTLSVQALQIFFFPETFRIRI